MSRSLTSFQESHISVYEFSIFIFKSSQRELASESPITDSATRHPGGPGYQGVATISASSSAHPADDSMAFGLFAQQVRNHHSFLSRATDAELRGIYDRLSPEERNSFTQGVNSPKAPSRSNKNAAKDVLPGNEMKIRRKNVVNKTNFIKEDAGEPVDDSGPDVSFVSNSDSHDSNHHRRQNMPKKDSHAFTRRDIKRISFE
jgi:hypothetical protein